MRLNRLRLRQRNAGNRRNLLGRRLPQIIQRTKMLKQHLPLLGADAVSFLGMVLKIIILSLQFTCGRGEAIGVDLGLTNGRFSDCLTPKPNAAQQGEAAAV